MAMGGTEDSGNAGAGRSLRWLLRGIADAPDIPVSGIGTDSRSLAAGEVFFAVQGARAHGLSFLDQVIASGAAAVVWDSDTAVQPMPQAAVLMIPVAGLQRRLGEIANRWFAAPWSKMQVSGVTGTNGKTTVAFLIAQCMRMLDRPCGYVGTLGAGMETVARGEGLTTPGCLDLHRHLADFAAQGARHLAIEVSSHALHQHRVDGVQFDSVLFTNLSRDHIDYHGDMQSYGEVKARFVLAGDVRNRMVMADSEFGRQLLSRAVGWTTAVSTRARVEADSFLQMRPLERDRQGTRVDVSSSWGDTRFYLPLVGDFNVENAALVLTQLLAWGVPLPDAAEVLGRVSSPPGRMQRVQTAPLPRTPAVFVDYAHTPAGLQAVLEALRAHCEGRLWCVFGCGGDRDRGKREEMGRTVAMLADRAVVTSDNPRSEAPGDIIRMVLKGMAADTVAIENRADAIEHAISRAADRDIVLIAGKGHEDYQLIGTSRQPFSDYQVALSRLEARGIA